MQTKRNYLGEHESGHNGLHWEVRARDERAPTADENQRLRCGIFLARKPTAFEQVQHAELNALTGGFSTVMTPTPS